MDVTSLHELLEIMKVFLAPFVVGIVLLASAAALAMGDEEHRMGGIPDMPAHILKMSGPHAGHRRAAAFGRLGDPAKVGTRIWVEATDPHTFSLDGFDVQAGETVEIVLHNAGRHRHQLVIGDGKHQAEYSRIVSAMPETRHEHDNVLTVDPGQTRSIVWEFGEPGPLELACHMEGHYEKGMLVRVTVRH